MDTAEGLWLPPPQVDIQDDGVLDILDGIESLEKVLSRAIVTRDMVADNAHHYSSTGFYFGYGQCLKFSRSCALAPGGVYDADAAWANADFKHTAGFAPRGTFVFWRGGAHGHVAVSEGEGWVWTTDYRRYGKVDLVRQGEITANWGMTPRGWTEDINGVHPIDETKEWDEMATKAEVREVMDNALADFVTSPALKNAIREGVQEELGDENVGEFSDRVANKVWDTKVTDPSDGTVKTLRTILRYAPSRAKHIVSSLGGKW